MSTARAMGQRAGRQEAHVFKYPPQGVPDLMRKEMPMAELRRLSTVSH
jgi:hypothetical protein